MTKHTFSKYRSKVTIQDISEASGMNPITITVNAKMLLEQQQEVE
jgi:hypothetical protein